MTAARVSAAVIATRDGEGTTGRPGRWPSPAGVVVLLAALLGFFMLSLDSTAVNVALPGIERDLGGSTAGLQWVIDAYTLLFAALLISGRGPARTCRSGPGCWSAWRVWSPCWW